MGEGPRNGLVGRDAPLRALVDAIRADRSTVVVGEAGIGKTSLVRAAVASSGRVLHEGGGFATLATMPYLALRLAVGAPLAGDAARAAATLERLVGPDLLFVDDLQWVDRESLAALPLLAGRILVLGAVRAGDPGAEAALAVARAAGLAELALDGLDPEAGGELVRSLRPDLGPGAVARIVGRSAGNPFVLEELALRGAPSPILTRSLTARLDRLSEAGRQTVRLLAVAGRPFRRSRLGAAAEEPIREGLAVERGDLVDIRHALLAEAIRSGLSEPEQRRLHRRAARLADEPAVAARHLAAAGRRREAAEIATAALDSAADPIERAALQVIAADAEDRGAGFERRLAAARALDELSEWDAVERVLAVTPSDVSVAQLVERDAMLACAAYAQGRIADARSLLERADALVVDPASPAAVRRTLEACRFAVNVDGAVVDALGRLASALAAVPAGSSEEASLRALREAIVALAAGGGDIDLLRSTSDAALAAGRFRTAADQARVVQYALLMRDGATAALDWLLDRQSAFADARVAGAGLEFHAEAVRAFVLAGRPGDAVTQADELLEQPAPLRARQAASISRARALVYLGRFDAAASGLVEVGPLVTGDWFGTGEWYAAQAELALWSGLPARAAEHADRALATASPVPGADTLVRITGDWGRWEANVPLGPERPAVAMRSLAGAVPEARALRLLAAQEPDAAAESFREAADAWAGYNAVRELVCRWAQGDALRLAGGTAAATEVLVAALGAAEAAGFAPLAARIRRSLRQAGVRVAALPRSPGVPILRLTGREHELVDLVEQGLTNMEIARRLGLGRPTVARMIASAMDKLGAERRTQLAALRRTS